MKKIFLIFLFLFSNLSIATIDMSFTSNLQKFGLWGSGIGVFDENVGHKGLGSIKLSTDFGENITAYRNFTGLKSGNYKISFYIKAQDIQSHKDTALWHFYDGGSGMKDVFRNKSGNFGWKKIEYTIYVKNEFQFWLRLKSPGKVWFDDFQIKKTTSQVTSYSSIISKLKGFRKKLKTKKLNKKKKRGLLVQKTNKINKSKYLNLYPSSFLIKNLNGYSRLKLDVINPTKNNYDFYLVVQDDKSNNYWSQLNFKNTLGPGKNSLNLNLNRALGERGSVKYNRKINLSNIRKLFIIVDPDKTGKPTKRKFVISKLELDNFITPIKPQEVIAFDFTSHKLDAAPSFTRVTSQDLYSKNKGHGFINPKFYRIYDSKYASALNRSTINVLDSGFSIDLPNGEYELEINVDSLGFWDVPFWKKREIYLNKALIYTSTRTSASEYLQDYFQFENVEPTPNDNLYDLYLSKIFKPINANVVVKNNKLHFHFKGDATGINLNSLIIWPKNKAKAANAYLQQIKDLNRIENDIISRLIVNKKQLKNKKIKVSFSNPTLDLTYSKNISNSSAELTFHGLSNESLFKIIQIRNSDNTTKLNFSIESLNSKGLGKAFSFHPLMYQYSALDMNHETYKLMAKIVAPKTNSIELEPNEVRYILVKVDFNQILKKNQRANLKIYNDDYSKNIILNIKKFNYELPFVNISAGFLGLDTMGPLYFKNKRLREFKQKLRIKALNILAKNGFTSFSGLPGVVVKRSKSGLNIEDHDFQSVLNEANYLNMGQALFTYSGEFPKTLLNSLKSKSDYDQANQYFAKIKNDTDQTIVYTFSDEATGYSDKLKENINIAKNLKQKIPNLLIGGFGDLDKSSRKLNDYFNYGFYSHLNKKDILRIKKKGHFWGTYNGSYLPMNDPQFAFGIGLYHMEKIGLNHYLDWHLNATHNYPYFELDGRETDAVMLYPRSNGDLYTSLKFEHAVIGLNTYRKLKLLDSLKSKMTSKHLKKYEAIKKKLRSTLNPYNFNSYYEQNFINNIEVNSKLSILFGSIK